MILVRRKGHSRVITQYIREHSNIRIVRADKRIPQNTVCVRWGYTGKIGNQLKVINNADAIKLASNKKEFRKVAPHVPQTWFNHTDDIRFPVVLRPHKHTQGRNFYVVNDRGVLVGLSNELENYYISELIEKDTEYRVMVAQGRVLWVTQKIPRDNNVSTNVVAWNHNNGFVFNNVRWDAWPLKAVKYSIESFNVTGLHFGAVDVIVKGRDVYVIEINTSLGTESPYRNDCIIKALTYMETNDTTIPLVEQRGGYKKFIHPCVCEGAWI